MIKAVIIDDEPKAIQGLTWELSNFESELEVVATFTEPEKAIPYLKDSKIDCLFLDIEMPTMDGFQFLEKIDNKDFAVVITTAYNEYAITALKKEAIDYLLKPIDIDLLKKSILKVEKNLNDKKSIHRYNLLQENNKKLAIPYKNDYTLIKIQDIACIEADRMYSKIHMMDTKTYLVSKKLSYYEELFKDNENFFRSHRSWIININKIESYSKKEKEVYLTNNLNVPISKSYKEKLETIYLNI